MSDIGRVSRGRNIVLMVSLCLNVALIAFFVTGVGRAVNRGFIAQPGGQLSPGSIARGLSGPQQDKIRDIIASHLPAMHQARQGARRARLAAFRAFAAPDYNPDTFAKALDDVRAADGRLEDEAIAALRDTTDKLTPEERQTAITRVRNGANRPWWRRWMPPPPQPKN
jgi:uncharacterized membrane protein